MLSDWQIMILNHGLWFVPAFSVLVLAVFPWKHWNSLIDEVLNESR